LLTPFDYGFWLRHYQQAAVLETESAIAHGQRAMLLAMATGTGKTKTCVALIYRLLKANASAACCSWWTAPPWASRPPTPSRTRAWKTCRPSPTSSASRSWT
jgi:DNA polymerase III delta prime subunit